MLRFRAGTLLLGAVRDEFVARPWDPPAAHWGGRVLGGRDRVAGGTWLAVDPDTPAVAAVLNGVPLVPPTDPSRLSRGALPLDALAGKPLPGPDELARYDGFHLVLATLDAVQVWTWDGVALAHRVLEPGDHIIVNDGIDAPGDPLVPHFLPLLAEAHAWQDWVELLAGAGLDPADPRALIVRRWHDGSEYGSTSASLVALGRDSVRYDFTADPGLSADWRQISVR
jgi:hypothetical protein